MNYPGPIKFNTSTNSSKSTEITEIQEQLKTLNCFGEYEDKPGFYGRYTYNAVIKFQSRYNLTPTGNIDKATWDKLFSGNLVDKLTLKEENAIKKKNIRMRRTSPEYLYQIRPYTFNGKIGKHKSMLSNKEFSGISYNSIDAETWGADSKFRSYIINAATNTWIPLPVIPESVSKSVSANWNDTTIIGRSASYRSYNGTSNRTVNFNLKFHMDLLEELTYDTTKLDLTRITDYLESLCYPEYSNSAIKPPVCILKLADVIKIRGTCDSVTVSYQLPIKTMVKGKYKGKLTYSQCDVSLQFTEVPVVAPTASGIASGKDYSR